MSYNELLRKYLKGGLPPSEKGKEQLDLHGILDNQI